MLKRIIAGLLFSTLAFAGNGSSGGGLVYGDKVNPWFLQNTTEVSYCLDVSPDFSEISVSEIEVLVDKAINFWKEKFNGKVLRGIRGLTPNPLIASQNFKHEDCTEKTMLRFQLGKLTEEQIKDNPGYKAILGFAHRETYDIRNLRGTGYIYLAPERGPLRPSSEYLHEKFWSYKDHGSLLVALTHELGHVFGLQDDHGINTYSNNVMSATMIEHYTSKEHIANAQVFLTDDELKNLWPLGVEENSFYRNIGVTFYNPSVTYIAPLFFGSNPKDSTFRIQGLGNQLRIYQHKKDDSGVWSDFEIGKIYLNNFSEKVEMEKREYVKLWLPKEQKVFTNNFEGQNWEITERYLPLVCRASSLILKDVLYVSTSGQERKMFINFNSESAPNIGGELDGKIYFDILRNR